ncbi:MAG: hypothetical protein OQJ89_15580, partial [Kangiellaceae bacterium]|nr:hypothetical protein [Kangiellaceae bacterium]
MEQEIGLSTHREQSNLKSDQLTSAQSPHNPLPGIELPRGGGAIKSIDEKFQVNAVNGTNGTSVALPYRGSRGFGLGLSLGYNSGSGDSAFGLGWNVSIPSIKRQSDKKLPR